MSQTVYDVNPDARSIVHELLSLRDELSGAITDEPDMAPDDKIDLVMRAVAALMNATAVPIVMRLEQSRQQVVVPKAVLNGAGVRR